MQQRKAHHINPRPSLSIVSSIYSFDADQHDDGKDGNDAPPPDTKYSATHALSLANLEPPQALEELAVYYDAHDRAVCSEEEIVEAHRCVGSVRVSVGILGFDGWGVEKRGCGQGVAGEAEHIQGGKVDCEAEGGFA